MQLDSKQEELLKILDKFIKSIPRTGKEIVSSWIKGLWKSLKNGIYIYGGVGRGKTMIMNKILVDCVIPYKIIHFQQFMQDVHKAVHILRKDTDSSFILHKFVNQYSEDLKLLFIDELEVKDIADAMILRELISEFIEQGVRVVFTSNTAPKNLYLDGMQREFFMPFIKMIEDDFISFHLDTEIDYRKEKAAAIQNKFFTKENAKGLQHIIDNFKDGGGECNEKSLSLYGREISFKEADGKILYTDFSELFERNFSSADYIEICKSFDIIIVKDIRKILVDETDIAIRLINFIDNAYLNHIILFCSFFEEIPHIYPKGKRSDEFQRTISRLHEMNSMEY